jgi:hypothetical protein
LLTSHHASVVSPIQPLMLPHVMDRIAGCNFG